MLYFSVTKTRQTMKITVSALLFFGFILNSFGQTNDEKINKLSNDIESKVLEWRRYLHENPELSNRELILQNILQNI